METKRGKIRHKYNYMPPPPSLPLQNFPILPYCEPKGIKAVKIALSIQGIIVLEQKVP